MSLCRFSSTDFLCDLYVYETDPDGFSVNVAKKRRVYKEPLPPFISAHDDMEGSYKRFRKVMSMGHTVVDIGLPYDGQSFSCDTAEETINVLTILKEAGYNAPYESMFAYLNDGENLDEN